LQYRESLSKRNTAETGIRYEWYALQRCAATYYAEFEKEKLVWSDISREPSFAVIPKSVYFNNTIYMILSDKYNFALCGILNSKINSWYFPKISTDLGENGMRYFKQFVECIPIPLFNNHNLSLVNKIESLVTQIITIKKQNNTTSTITLEAQIDHLVYQLYDLTPEEIAVVEGKT
jgi:adenine-specific DNA-methyltransferase